MEYDDREEAIEALLLKFTSRLIEGDDLVLDLVTRSNCFAWGLDDYQNLRVWRKDETGLGFSVVLYLSGEQDEDAPSPLDVIVVSVEGEAAFADGGWEISDYNVLSAEYDVDYAEAEDYVDAVTSNVNYFQTFSDEISSLRLLNTVNIPDAKAAQTLRRQVYVGAITCLETYLSDAFINTVLSDEKFLESFFANYDFKEKKLDMKGLYNYAQRVEDIAKGEMLEVRYHNLPKVSTIYKAVLKVEFPKFQAVAKAISTRHDLVHRNGKTKDGADVLIGQKAVDDVISEVESFVREIDQGLRDVVSPQLDDEDIPF